jgi:hypothetical protein
VQHCNNDDDDIVMRASVWFEFFGGFFLDVKNCDIWEGMMITKRDK